MSLPLNIRKMIESRQKSIKEHERGLLDLSQRYKNIEGQISVFKHQITVLEQRMRPCYYCAGSGKENQWGKVLDKSDGHPSIYQRVYKDTPCEHCKGIGGVPFEKRSRKKKDD